MNPNPHPGPHPDPTASIHAEAAAWALTLCDRIAAHTDVPGTITRLFLSPATARVHALLTAEMQSLGMHVRLDSAGNLRGLLPGPSPGSPVLLLGSHLDTVPNAGRYDGILGVALPLALLRQLHHSGTRLPYAVELIAFSEEEGVRFRLPFLGSRALAGTLGPAELARTDPAGISIAQALTDFGLDPTAYEQARLTPHTFAFLELHIEQGPVLDTLNLPLGVVTAIAGQTRLSLTFTGSANHAGTTPMALRRDALTAAAAFITAVEAHARATPELVATVGVIEAQPGAPNIVTGLVTLSLDVRHTLDATRNAAIDTLLNQAQTIASERTIALATRETSHQDAVPMHPGLTAALSQALHATGHTAHAMPSGAGHDAMILAPLLPTAMLFLRTPNGLSHHPAEAVSAADCAAALATLHALLVNLQPAALAP